MRHRVVGKKLNRSPAERRVLKRNLAGSLIEQGKITTTLPKAKFVKPFVEKLLTKAKQDSLANHRLVIARLGNKPTWAKALRERWAPQFKNTPGGYLRIVKLGKRSRDGAEMATLEFVKKSPARKKKNEKSD